MFETESLFVLITLAASAHGITFRCDFYGTINDYACDVRAINSTGESNITEVIEVVRSC